MEDVKVQKLARTFLRICLLAFVVVLFGLLKLVFPGEWLIAEKEEQNISHETELELGKMGQIDVESGMIIDVGLEAVKNRCQRCHSLDLVKQNRATREGWKDIIVWMQNTQELEDLGEDEAQIIDYLSTYFAPENKGRRANLENIEWYAL